LNSNPTTSESFQGIGKDAANFSAVSLHISEKKNAKEQPQKFYICYFFICILPSKI